MSKVPGLFPCFKIPGNFACLHVTRLSQSLRMRISYMTSLEIFGICMLCWESVNPHLDWIYVINNIYIIRFLQNQMINTNKKTSKNIFTFPLIKFYVTKHYYILEYQRTLSYVKGNISGRKKYFMHIKRN